MKKSYETNCKEKKKEFMKYVGHFYELNKLISCDRNGTRSVITQRDFMH